MHLAIVWLALSCEPAPDLQREIQAATHVVVHDATDFEANIASLRGLRARHPDDLFVHERYQDAVARHGIEGHVKAMVQEYEDRATQAPDDLVARYLFARALIGRSTASAIQALTRIVADHPEFAPAHRALAATYAATTAWHDEVGARVERERWHTLCPRVDVPPWSVSVPDPSPLMEAAERLFGDSKDLERVEAMALQAIRDDEWRLQRMRPFDWFSVEEKRDAQRALSSAYWRLWGLQVRCHLEAGRVDQARQLLAQMKRRLGAQPDPVHASQLERLQQEIARRGV